MYVDLYDATPPEPDVWFRHIYNERGLYSKKNIYIIENLPNSNLAYQLIHKHIKDKNVALLNIKHPCAFIRYICALILNDKIHDVLCGEDTSETRT